MLCLDDATLCMQAACGIQGLIHCMHNMACVYTPANNKELPACPVPVSASRLKCNGLLTNKQ